MITRSDGYQSIIFSLMLKVEEWEIFNFFLFSLKVYLKITFINVISALFNNFILFLYFQKIDRIRNFEI